MSEATIPAQGPVDVLVGRLRVAATKLGRSDEWEDLRDDLHHAAAEIERLRAAETETADVGGPVAWAHFAENGNIRLWAPERPRDLAGNAALPLYTADQLAAAVAAAREKCAGIVNELRMECARRNMPESATMLWHAEDALRAGGEWGE